MKNLLIGITLSGLIAASAYGQDADLPIKCQHGVLTEIYAAKASKFKANGSVAAFEKARTSALENAAELGYPDSGVDSMITAGIEDYKVDGSITERLASLSTDDLVISPLIQDCLHKPENYIRNYKN